MTAREARSILGIEGDADTAAIKKRYHRLMLQCHPDAAASEERDPRRAREIIEAYRTLTRPGQTGAPDPDSWWDALVLASAPAERSVYVRYRFFDEEELPAVEAARGRFLWDPEIEEFPLFCKSILELDRRLSDGSDRTPDADRFHRLMQCYIDPLYCVLRLQEPMRRDEDGTVWYRFKGHLRPDAGTDARLPDGQTEVMIDCEGDSAYAAVRTGDGALTRLGRISFDEDSLYYVLLPLIRDKKVRVAAALLPPGLSPGGGRRRSIRIEVGVVA